jgi:hypothetical protein
MKISSMMFILCLLLTVSCLGFGYLSAGYWQVLVAVVFLAILWVFVRKRSRFWAAAILLLGSAMLAARGMLINISPLLMVIACTAGLVSWDLYLFNGEVSKNSLPHAEAFLARNHMRALAMAAMAGLLLALAGVFIRFELPFGSLVLLALMVVGGLLYSVQYLNRSR